MALFNGRLLLSIMVFEIKVGDIIISDDQALSKTNDLVSKQKSVFVFYNSAQLSCSFKCAL